MAYRIDAKTARPQTRIRAAVRKLSVCWCAVALFAAVPVSASGPYAGKRVLHVDSYHEGNQWNTAISEAVERTLDGTGVELRVLRMDTKRNRSEEFKREAALRVKAEIESFKPDVVTASDDNAAKYLIAGHYKDADLPFVFCGVNWDASVYGFPYRNVTGMVEVSPIPQIISLMRQHAKGDRVGYLTEDTPTKRKEMEHHRKLFGIEYDEVYLVRTFDEWKSSFRAAQEEVDMLVLLGVAAVEDWSDEEAARFAQEQTRIPTGTDFGWLMHISMFGVGKSPAEQGEWAAKAALKILDGTSPSQIPLTYNTRGELFFNKTIASRIGLSEPPALAKVVE